MLARKWLEQGAFKCRRYRRAPSLRAGNGWISAARRTPITARDPNRCKAGIVLAVMAFHQPGPDPATARGEGLAGLTVLGDGDILAMPSGIGSENAKCRFVDGRALGKVGIATAPKWLLDHVSKDSPHIIKVDTIPIDSVVIGENRRSLNPEMVAQLAKSMAAIGQRMPITVRSVSDADDSTTVLVCGLHRIAAAEAKKKISIQAKVCPQAENASRPKATAVAISSTPLIP